MTAPDAKPHLRIHISGYFDDADRQQVLTGLREAAAVEEFSPQRGGFPMPIEIILEIPWAEIVAGILANEIWGKVKSLYRAFREKQEREPDPVWSTTIHLEVRVTTEATTIETSINTSDEAVAEAAIQALPPAVNSVLSKAAPSNWEQLLYNNVSKRWQEPPPPPPGVA